MSDDKTWLTPAAHEKLVDEYEHLTTVGRREIEQRIAEARDHGEVREVKNSGSVEVGTIATVVDDDGDELEFFVAPAENKVGVGILLASPESPLGSALLGSKPGDAVTYEAPGGTFTYTVRAVRAYEG